MTGSPARYFQPDRISSNSHGFGMTVELFSFAAAESPIAELLVIGRFAPRERAFPKITVHAWKNSGGNRSTLAKSCGRECKARRTHRPVGWHAARDVQHVSMP